MLTIIIMELHQGDGMLVNGNGDSHKMMNHNDIKHGPNGITLLGHMFGEFTRHVYMYTRA